MVRLIDLLDRTTQVAPRFAGVTDQVEENARPSAIQPHTAREVRSRRGGVAT